MPTALSDPSTTLYAILGVFSLVLGIVALRKQRRTDLINFAIPAVAFLALVIIDHLYESPREQIVVAVGEMEAGTQNKKLDDVFKHVSDKFQYKFQNVTMDKKGLQEKARQAESISSWEGIKVNALTRDRFRQLDVDTAEQRFDVQPLRLPGNEYRFECVATFKKEGEAWRLAGFKLFKDGQEVTPPGG
jgi:hypothetical protein